MSFLVENWIWLLAGAAAMLAAAAPIARSTTAVRQPASTGLAFSRRLIGNLAPSRPPGYRGVLRESMRPGVFDDDVSGAR